MVTVVAMTIAFVTPTAAMAAPIAAGAAASAARPAPAATTAPRTAAPVLGPGFVRRVQVSDTITRQAAIRAYATAYAKAYRKAYRAAVAKAERQNAARAAAARQQGATAGSPTAAAAGGPSAAELQAAAEAEARAVAEANAAAQGWPADSPTGSGSVVSADCTSGEEDGVVVVSCPVPPSPEALTAASAPDQPVGADAALSGSDLDAASADALADWAAADPAADLSGITFAVEDLPGLLLGQTSGRAVTVDVDAAGWGWGVGSGGMDLRTVLRHEIGHAVGLDHTASGLMADTLAAGDVKQVPVADPPTSQQTSSDQSGDATVR